MTKKTWTKIDKKGHTEEWSIEESPEVIAAIKALVQKELPNLKETPEVLAAIKAFTELKTQDDNLNYDTSGK